MKILMLGLLASTMAFSMLDKSTGDWGSGGGNAIVCFKDVTIIDHTGSKVNILKEIKENRNIIPDKFIDSISSIEMYDLYEAKKPRGIGSVELEILAPNDDEEIYNYINRLARRFSNNVPAMRRIVQDAREIVQDRNIFFNPSAVKYQNDLGSMTLPSKSCVISTMAAQVNYNTSYQVHIDSRLYNHKAHSLHSKATLILHELLYAYGRFHFDHKDSGAVRELVGLYMTYDKRSESSITEGVVSKSLAQLHFVEKTDNLDYDLFKSTMLFQKIKAFSKEYYDLTSSLYYQETKRIESKILNEIRVQCEFIGYETDCTEAKTFADIRYLLHDFLDNYPTHHLKWIKIIDSFDLEIKLLKEKLLAHLDVELLKLSEAREHLNYWPSHGNFNNSILNYDIILSTELRDLDLKDLEGTLNTIVESKNNPHFDITKAFFKKSFCSDFTACRYGYPIANRIPRE